MQEAHSEAGDRPAGLTFDAIERRLPFAKALSARINSLPDEPIEWVYWFIALLGMLSALRADLLFPHTWFDRIQSDYSFSWIENPLGFFQPGIRRGSARAWDSCCAVRVA